MLMVSCKNTTKHKGNEMIINLEYNTEDYPHLDQSDYELSFKILPLEQTTNAIIGNISSVERTKNYIYILDARASKVFIFRSNGEFVNQIEKGNAKNELISPMHILIDRVTNNLEILDFQSIIKIYDEIGNYIDKIDTEAHNVEFDKIGNRYVLYNGKGSKENGGYYFTVLDGNKRKHYVEICGDARLAHFQPKHINYNSATKALYFNAHYDDAIYKMSENDPKPILFARVENVFKGIGMDIDEAKINAECAGRKFPYFRSFTVLLDGNLIAMSVDKDGMTTPIYYDTVKKIAYNSPLNNIPYIRRIFSGNNTSTLHIFEPTAFSKIDPTKLSPSEIKLYKLIKERYEHYGDDDCTYIIEITYNKK